MATLDPRKNESITNQANYLMTAVTTLLVASFTTSMQTGSWYSLQYVILGIFWVMAAGYREIKRLVTFWTREKSSSDSLKEPTP